MCLCDPDDAVLASVGKLWRQVSCRPPGCVVLDAGDGLLTQRGGAGLAAFLGSVAAKLLPNPDAEAGARRSEDGRSTRCHVVRGCAEERGDIVWRRLKIEF